MKYEECICTRKKIEGDDNVGTRKSIEVVELNMRRRKMTK